MNPNCDSNETNNKSMNSGMDSKDKIGINKDLSEREDGEIDEEEEEKNLYCICRTSETNRFMIGCDRCEEWYHGDCIAITQEYAKRIQLFYCLMCRDKDNTLEIKFKERKNKKRDSESIAVNNTINSSKSNSIGVNKQKSVNNTLNSNTNSNTNSNNSITNNNNNTVDNTEFVKFLKERDPDYKPVERERKRTQNYYISDEDEDEDYYDSNNDNKRSKKHNKEKNSTNRRRGRPVKEKEDKRRKPYRNSMTKSRHRKKDETKSKTHKKNKEHVVEVESGPKQCYGPACVNAARKGSKYCSDECGVKLATNRIYEILPHRIRQWQSTPCDADERSHKSLEAIRNEQQEARRILNELDVRQRELEILINSGKSIPPLTEEESNEAENEAETELSMYCVTCGHEINHKIALKHMERCYNKYESQTSFGSIFKTKIEGQTVFCDVFNPQQRTYCKRLRILCPEHSKDPKIADDEVCGCPLVSPNCPFEHNGKFCRVLKKKCNKHHCWEKLRRAELDAERIQQWLKLDDLFEREQKIRYCMANRHGILGLMLHQTIVHDDNESQLH